MAIFENADKQLGNYTTKGCFIVSGERPNVMTASWGFIGVMWGRRVAVVPIRDSRFTREIIDRTGEFTMCIPYDGKMAKELTFCGTKSGRDIDKVKECNMTVEKAKSVDTFVIGGCDAYFECRVLQTLTFNGQELTEFAEAQYGKNPDYHNFYIAEITKEY